MDDCDAGNKLFSEKGTEMKTLDEMIAVMQAAKEGKQIQSRPYKCSCCKPPKECTWRDDNNPAWNWRIHDYRVKPEPRRWRGHTTLDGGFISCDHANCKHDDWVEVVEVLK
jgi:hypothetical protein